MKHFFFVVAAGLFAAGAQAQTNNYTVASIVTNVQDARLVNPWGLSRPPTNNQKRNEWWAVDQVTGRSTLYSASGNILGLAVTIPNAIGTGSGSPTGIANMPASAGFAFATLDGTISVWNAGTMPSNPGTHCYQCHVSTASIAVNNAATGASYQGLTIAKNATSGAMTYYVANNNGGVEAYDATSYSPVVLPAGAFTDSKIPAGYLPAGIQAIGAVIYVAYNATAGGGTGYVDGFDTNGKLLVRLQNGWFDQPWAIVATPANFGLFSNMLLVGNTGSGWIGAYDRKTGAFKGFLQSGGNLLTIPGLWGLGFGNGTPQAGPANVLYFTAGGANYTTGVFGSITPN